MIVILKAYWLTVLLGNVTVSVNCTNFDVCIANTIYLLVDLVLGPTSVTV